MRRIVRAFAISLALAASSGLASGADRYAPPPSSSAVLAPGCRVVEVCDPFGCRVRHLCRRTCPDRYSCSSLYGAYGPYGGRAYWGAYTSTGWGYR